MRNFPLIALLILLLMGANTAPPRYNNANDATVEAQPVGRSFGYSIPVPITTATDALSTAAISGASVTGLLNWLRAGYGGSSFFTPGNEQANPTVITIKRVYDDASDANLAICAQLGPDLNGTSALSSSPQPALSCAEKNAHGNTGGCYLTTTNDSCTFIIRKMTEGCQTWETCHIPLWIVASGGNDNGSTVSIQGAF